MHAQVTLAGAQALSANAERRRGCDSLLPRESAVRWNVATDIVVAWIVALPAAALLATTLFTNFFASAPHGSNFAAQHRFMR
jgi:phosphate/sulfate permease